MSGLSQLFESVADVWLLWAVAAAALVWLSRKTFSVSRPWNLRSLLSEERGASYTLSVVLVMPVYVLLVALIIECTLMLVVKMGTTYAAYSAARAAIVWQPAEDSPDQRRRQIERAAVHALTPFASSTDAHARGTIPDPFSEQVEYQAFRLYSRKSGGSDYLARKRRCAAGGTRVRIEQIAGTRNVRVTVEYDMPLNVPGVARFLGVRTPTAHGFYVRRIASTVILELETPKSRTQTLGIRYRSLDL